MLTLKLKCRRYEPEFLAKLVLVDQKTTSGSLLLYTILVSKLWSAKLITSLVSTYIKTSYLSESFSSEVRHLDLKVEWVIMFQETLNSKILSFNLRLGATGTVPHNNLSKFVNNQGVIFSNT